MKLLWHTHTFLWFVAGNSELSWVARRAIETPAHLHFISIAAFGKFPSKQRWAN
jgi:PIN domain nuclease of toxin-antitoxin system